jgi:hypothetical protein
MDLVGGSKTFTSYKQMHEVLINKNVDIKKWAKKDPDRGKNNFSLCLADAYDLPEWTRHELAQNSMKFLGSFNVSTLLSSKVLKKLEEKEIRPIDEIDDHDLYWFLVTDVKPKLTKNKKPYLLVTATGISGQSYRMFCWGWDGQTPLEVYSLCIAEVKKNDFGYQTSMSKVRLLRV